MLTLVHSPPEKKFSFLNPDELAKMKEEEGKSARRTDFSWPSIHSFLQREHGVAFTRCTLATVSFMLHFFFLCHLWLSHLTFLSIFVHNANQRGEHVVTFIDLTQHLWSFTFHRVILVTQSFVRFAERRIASMTKMEFERMASEAQLKADEEAEAALESVDQIEGVLRRPSQIGNQGNTRT